MGVIAKQSVRGTIWTYIGVLVGLVTVFFVQTRFLTTEEIGLARVLVDAATLFIGLAQLGMGSAIVRFFPYFNEKTKGESEGAADGMVSENEKKDPYHGFFFYAVVIPFVGFLLFALIYWLCHAPIQHYFISKSPLFVDYYYFVLPIAFFMLYQSVFESCSNVLMHTVFPRSVVKEFLVRVGLLVLYLLYAFRVLTIDGFVIGLCAVYAIAALCNIIYVFTTEHISLRPQFDYLTPSLVRRFLLYIGFLVLSAAVSVFSPLLSSFMVTAEMGLSYTGIFAIATYIAVMVSIPSRSMFAVAQPELSRHIKEGNHGASSHLMQQVSGSLLLVGSMIFLMIWVNIDLIFYLMPNGDTFAQGKTVVLLLCLTQLLITTFSLLISALSYSKHYYITLLLSLVLTILIIVFNNRLIPLMGMDGAALAMLLGNMVYFIGAVVAVVVMLRMSPVNSNHLKIVLLFLVLFALNYVLTRFVSPLIDNIWLDAILRNLLLVPTACLVAYKGRLSEEINQYVENAVGRYKRSR